MEECGIKQKYWNFHRFLLMIIIVVFISIGLVVVALALYSSSGAAQLDLSRPGYVDVRSKTVDNSSDFKNYPNMGTIDQAAINEFTALYDAEASKIKLADAFKGDPLNPNELGISADLQ